MKTQKSVILVKKKIETMRKIKNILKSEIIVIIKQNIERLRIASVI